jgi:hypothetical protein
VAAAVVVVAAALVWVRLPLSLLNDQLMIPEHASQRSEASI